MNREVVKQLKMLINEYGIDLCDKPKRCRALLMNLCSDHIKEIRILYMAMEINMPQELLSSRNIPYEIACSRLAQKLWNEFGITDQAAFWCVDAWAFALGVKDALQQVPGVSASKHDDNAKKEKKLETLAMAEPTFYKPDLRLTSLDTDYYISYVTGTVTLGELAIGTRVVDPTWAWEFRTGWDYTPGKAGDEIKPVTWIVVAKDHYVGLAPHVTLLAEELIGRFVFDDSTSRGSKYGSNHWGESGTANATRGLRPWLNSSGIHSGEGFNRAFSEHFNEAVLATIVPNREWEKVAAYSTEDHVFLPSTTELGDSSHDTTYTIGSVYPYFYGVGKKNRKDPLESIEVYWTRSPDSRYGSRVRIVRYDGEFYFGAAGYSGTGVRPALNLKSGTLASEIRN